MVFAPCRSGDSGSSAFCSRQLQILAGSAETPNTQTGKTKLAPHTDISLGVFGQITPSRVPVAVNNLVSGTAITQTTQGTSSSAGVLGTFHQSFAPWLGYNVNLGYSRLSENYSEGAVYIPAETAPSGYHQTDHFLHGSIGTNMYELTAAYAVQGPRNKRFSTLAQLGGGMLAFLLLKIPLLCGTVQSDNGLWRRHQLQALGPSGATRRVSRPFSIKIPISKTMGPFPTTKLFTVTNGTNRQHRVYLWLRTRATKRY